MRKKDETVWIPEICYDEPTESAESHIPFIEVPLDKEMPKFIFISEYKQTGEFEPGSKGEELPVVDMTLHQYADMDALKQGLSSEEYDRVRAVLGLLPYRQAYKMGQAITDKVRNNLASH